MDDEREEGLQGAFLPPVPGGREPDLNTPPAPAGESSPQPDVEQGGWQPPQLAQPVPPQPPQPPAHQQQVGWSPPPPPGWQRPAAQPWAYQPQPATPDNGSAVAGFVLSVVAGTLLLLSAGLSSIVSVVCAGLGIFYSRRGRLRVDRGETPKHRGLAQAGFITGIVSLVLAMLATAFWLLILILALTDEEFRNDFENDLEDPNANGVQSTVLLAGMLGRLVWSLLA